MHQIAIQLPDRSVVFGYLKNLMIGMFQKFSPDLELIWESEIPVPVTASSQYPYVNPLGISTTRDSGFICTGQYYFSNTGESAVWIGKMDADGCWDVGCSTITTASPNPSKGGELLKASPNPAKDYFTIEVNNLAEEGEIQIYDIKGVLIFSSIIDKNNQGLTVRTSAWASGTYFYRYSIAGKTQQSGKIEVLK